MNTEELSEKPKRTIERNVPMTGTKICRKCRLEKDVKKFNQDKSMRSRRSSVCRKCAKAYRTTLPNWWIIKRVAYSNDHHKNIYKGNIEKLSTAGIEAILKLQQNKCKYCDILLTDNNLALDHQTPLSKGGHNLNSNIAAVCSDCNRLKHTKTDEEFKIFLSEYTNRFARQFETEGLKQNLSQAQSIETETG